MGSQVDAMASSTGQVMTAASWLDTHFEAAKPEYGSQLQAVGIQPGWHVLDAACGSGSFLRWLADLVGPTGRLVSLDLAPDNIAKVEQCVPQWALPCPVETHVGSVCELPYPDNTFDAIWFANTSQYLTDDELESALAEFGRVVRPGGLVAVKETDVTMYRVEPTPPGLILRYFQALAKTGNVQADAGLRAPALPFWLRKSGLTNVRRSSTIIERTQPFSPVVRTLWHDLFAYLAAVATNLHLPNEDAEFWAKMREPATLQNFMDDPDCWLIECNILTVGTVPDDADTTDAR